MNYNIAAIPTTYANIRFRSRLEAKWAAFFTALDWQWEYEPIDLKGWIPDFVLLPWKNGKPVYCEVKPVFDAPVDVMRKMESATEPGWALMILGASVEAMWLANGRILCTAESDDDCPSFDDSCPPDCEHIDWGWDRASIDIFDHKRPGICQREQSFRDVLSGDHDGGCHGGDHGACVAPAWAEATNAIQWIKRRCA